ncbi:hypothetical protein FXF51_55540 [Nonomuraea sp. PA05]|uniref:chorismate-binding protein n=1 Tax=Nonomuraea sp. PA05 TaxID=2604466 RepID=UPI0011D3D0AC|nr:chorismate-binding protein [Nonomuraea sp. PA05]TYB50612.1 hypothetical protein FXF51_55540 [Nonomuraea sp. PA05]
MHLLTTAADPLAGSDRAESVLFASAKDLHEHRLVAEAVADAPAPYCKDLHGPVIPEPTSTETMWHLSSRVMTLIERRQREGRTIGFPGLVEQPPIAAWAQLLEGRSPA